MPGVEKEVGREGRGQGGEVFHMVVVTEGEKTNHFYACVYGPFKEEMISAFTYFYPKNCDSIKIEFRKSF